MKKLLSTLWRYLRWVFPPYLAWRFIVLPICWVVSWPFRQVKALLFGKKGGRKFKTVEEGQRWSDELWSSTTEDPTLQSIISFRDIWSTKQSGASYISEGTLIHMCDRSGYSMIEMLYLMTSPYYPRGYTIHGWEELLRKYGVPRRDSHTHATLNSFWIEVIKKDHGSL